MGHIALQRVIVRMLYDPAFVRRVYADDARTLAGCDIDAHERAWLLATDVRAWRVDPHRRARSLAGLLEEFPVACALVVRRAVGTAALDAFFSSEIFHAGMQHGHYLALDFADHLCGFDDVWLAATARLERALALARRRVAHVGAQRGQWRLANHVRLVELPAGGLSFYQEALAQLRHAGLASAVIDAQRPLPLPVGAEGEEHLLAVAAAGDAHLERLTPELFAVLDRAQRGASEEQMLATFGELGATEAEAREILWEFVESGELRSPGGD